MSKPIMKPWISQSLARSAYNINPTLAPGRRAVLLNLRGVYGTVSGAIGPLNYASESLTPVGRSITGRPLPNTITSITFGIRPFQNWYAGSFTFFASTLSYSKTSALSYPWQALAGTSTGYLNTSLTQWTVSCDVIMGTSQTLQLLWTFGDTSTRGVGIYTNGNSITYNIASIGGGSLFSFVPGDYFRLVWIRDNSVTSIYRGNAVGQTRVWFAANSMIALNATDSFSVMGNYFNANQGFLGTMTNIWVANTTTQPQPQGNQAIGTRAEGVFTLGALGGIGAGGPYT